MKTKPSMFINTKTMTPYYGIKVLHKGEWVDAGDSNGRFGFKTVEERDTKRKELEAK